MQKRARLSGLLLQTVIYHSLNKVFFLARISQSCLAAGDLERERDLDRSYDLFLGDLDLDRSYDRLLGDRDLERDLETERPFLISFGVS